jgi:hypothetical protein
VPFHPFQEVVGRRVNTAGADDHVTSQYIPHRFAVEVVAHHGARLLLVAESEDGVPHVERTGDVLLKQIGIGLLGGTRHGHGEQVKAEIRVEDGRTRREQQRLLLDPVRESIPRYGRERIGVRAWLMRNFAREAARVSGEIDQRNLVQISVHTRSEIRLPFGERVREPDRALSDEMSQHVAGERLGDRPDAHDRVTVRRGTPGTGTLAEASDRHFSVANRADHDGGDLSVNEEDLAGELDDLVEHSVGSGARRCKRRADAEGDQSAKNPRGRRRQSHAILVFVRNSHAR